ncbi:hypothetical protein CERSUDRAFT_124797 [Gelatoporia subvermispora B]|uniref:C2H2-type domain-containing protein n=1 Tax=Ceriporiopsis subvermispora (strain B) TaxID=914234 RepID=M2RAQ5_CERS8|nr:hypothetical protein CERSUDRAFT_124797 [Gelatoporia subvermispora B]
MRLRWLHGEMHASTSGWQAPVEADDVMISDEAFIDDSAAFRTESFDYTPQSSRMQFVMEAAPPPAPDTATWVSSPDLSSTAWPVDIPRSMVHSFRADPLRAIYATNTRPDFDPELPFPATGPLEMFGDQFQVDGYEPFGGDGVVLSPEDSARLASVLGGSPQSNRRHDSTPALSHSTTLSPTSLSPSSAYASQVVPLPSDAFSASPSDSMISLSSPVQLKRKKRKTRNENRPPQASSDQTTAKTRKKRKTIKPLSKSSESNGIDVLWDRFKPGELDICAEVEHVSARQQVHERRCSDVEDGGKIPQRMFDRTGKTEVPCRTAARDSVDVHPLDELSLDSPLSISNCSHGSANSLSLQAVDPPSVTHATPLSTQSSAYASCPESSFQCSRTGEDVSTSPQCISFITAVARHHGSQKSLVPPVSNGNQSVYARDSATIRPKSVIGLGLYTEDHQTDLGLDAHHRKDVPVATSSGPLVEHHIRPHASSITSAACRGRNLSDVPSLDFSVYSRDCSTHISGPPADHAVYSCSQAIIEFETAIQMPRARGDIHADSLELGMHHEQHVDNGVSGSEHRDSRPASHAQLAQGSQTVNSSDLMKHRLPIASGLNQHASQLHLRESHGFNHGQHAYSQIHQPVPQERQLQPQIQLYHETHGQQAFLAHHAHVYQPPPYAHHVSTQSTWTASSSYAYPLSAPPAAFTTYADAGTAYWQHRPPPMHLPPASYYAHPYVSAQPAPQHVPQIPPVHPVPEYLVSSALPPLPPAPIAIPLPFPVPLPTAVPAPDSWTTLFATLKMARKRGQLESGRRHTRRVRRTEMRPVEAVQVPAETEGQKNTQEDEQVQGDPTDQVREEDTRLPEVVTLDEEREEEGPGEYRCPLCPRVFRLPNGLAIHLKWHWGLTALEWRRRDSNQIGSTFERASMSAQRTPAVAEGMQVRSPSHTATSPVAPAQNSPDTISPPAVPPATAASGFSMPVIPLGTPHTSAGLFSLRSESESLSLFGSPAGTVSPWTPRAGGSWSGNASAACPGAAATTASNSAGPPRSSPTWSEHLFGRESELIEQPSGSPAETTTDTQQQHIPNIHTAAEGGARSKSPGGKSLVRSAPVKELT